MLNKVVVALESGRLSPASCSDALAAGMCGRCILRFSGVESMAIYTASETIIENALEKYTKVDDVKPILRTKDSVCTCCVGVLQSSFHGDIITNVQTKMKENQYDVKTFALNIKLPSVVLLREYVLRHHLKQSMKRVERINLPFDMKDVLKAFVVEPIVASFPHSITCVNTSELSILLDIQHAECAAEVQQIPAIKEQVQQQSRKRTRGPPVIVDGCGSVNRALAALSTMPSTIICPPQSPTTRPTCDVNLEREPVYLQGRYLKYKRGLSQTPWIIDNVRMGESSVEECIGEIILPYLQGSGYKFHTAGREDVDVRMLGNGRPFILEILDAKKGTLSIEEYATIQAKVNTKNDGEVEIRHLQVSTKEYFTNLQAGADTKRKTYCCVVWSADQLTSQKIAKLNAIQDLVIEQKTPLRVLHRRTLMTRSKIVHKAQCEVLNAHYMLLRLTTSAGTYVKEFVHSDRGRTYPNVASLLGCDADILQLDVESLVD